MFAANLTLLVREDGRGKADIVSEEYVERDVHVDGEESVEKSVKREELFKGVLVVTTWLDQDVSEDVR